MLVASGQVVAVALRDAVLSEPFFRVFLVLMAYGAGKQPTRVAGMSTRSPPFICLLSPPCMHRSGTQSKLHASLTSARSPLSTSSDTYHLFCAPASALHTYCRRRDNYAHQPSYRRTLLCNYYLPRKRYKHKRPTAAAAARPHPGSPAVAQQHQHACRPPAVASTAFLARAVAVEAATAPSLPIMAVCSTVSNATSPKPRSSVKYVHVHAHIHMHTHTVTCLLAALLPPPGCCSAERAASSSRHAADLCSAGPAPPP